MGEVELENNVLVIRRIHVKMLLKAAESQRGTIERVHGFFADKCPVYLSLKNAIAITTEVTLEPYSKPE